MNKLALLTVISALAGAGAAAAASSPSEVIVATDAYRWQGDTIFQGEYKAWAVSPDEIQSTYSARPQ